MLTLLICSIRVSQWVLKSGSVSIASWSFVFAVMLALLFGLAVGFGLSTNDEYCFLIGRDFGLFKIDLGLGALKSFSKYPPQPIKLARQVWKRTSTILASKSSQPGNGSLLLPVPSWSSSGLYFPDSSSSNDFCFDICFGRPHILNSCNLSVNFLLSLSFLSLEIRRSKPGYVEDPFPVKTWESDRPNGFWWAPKWQI